MKAQKIADDLKNAEKRLKELKSVEAIENKKAEISKLESKLTTKGKVLTMLNNGLNIAIKEGTKAIKNKQRANRTTTRRRKRRGSK